MTSYKYLSRTIASILLAVVVFTNSFSFTVTLAKEARDNRITKLRSIHTKTHYRDMKSAIREGNADRKTKKLSAIRSSLRKGSEYRIIVRTSEDRNTVSDLLAQYDAGGEAHRLANGIYEIRVSQDSDLARETLSEIDTDSLPETFLGRYPVVIPTPIESLSESPLTGERTSDMWGMTSIHADKYQSTLAHLSRTKIAILDTGIAASHPDLSGNVNTTDSYDFIANTAGSTDDNGHGTHVGGVIAGKVNGQGIFGVDSNAEIISEKVLDANGVGSSYDVVRAIQDAVNKGAKVLNLSFGGYGNPSTDPICQAITDAKTQWVTTIVAAGNSNADVSAFVPAGCSDAITIGAVDQSGNKALFSNYGSNVILSAPWVDILSTSNDGGYKTMGGTSASSAFVAGAVGAIIAQDDTKTPDQIKTILKSSGNVLDMDTIFGFGTSSTTTNSGAILISSGATAGSGTTLSGSTASGVVILPPQDPGLYYSGSFVYNGVHYGNSYYTGVTFPESVLRQYGVKIMREKPKNTGVMTVMSVPTSGLVGEWKLDGNANDTSGQGNNGTAYNVSWVSSTLWLQSLNGAFNGHSSSVSFTHNISLTGLTLSAWFYSTSTYWNNSIIVNNWANNNSILFDLGNNFKPRFCLKSSVWWYNGIWSPNTIGLNSWHHMVGTWDGSNMRLFIDWELLWTSTFGGTININDTWNIWRYTWGVDYFSGNLQWVRIYNRALSSSEIQDLYHEGDGVNTTIATPTLSFPWTSLSALAGSLSYVSMSNQTLIFDPNKRFVAGGYSSAKQQNTTRDGSKNQSIDQADPVNLATGEFTYSNTFMSIPWVGNPYEFSLTYRTGLDYEWPVGNKFDHNYNIFLTESTGAVTLYNGKLGIFSISESGSTYAYDQGLKAQLAKSGSGLYSLAFDNGTKYDFASNLRIAHMTDKNGNALSFSYNTGAQLTSVTDSLGRVVDYSYGSDTRLTSVTDFNDRSVSLAYFTGTTASGSLGDLRSVTIASPVGTGSVSKTVSFTYDSNHNIVTMTDSKGQVYVTNSYNSDHRVTSQIYGSGTTSYSYTLSGSQVTANAVTNANGIETTYEYDSNGNLTDRTIHDATGTGTTVYHYEYDSNARLVKTILPRGNGTTYTYDSRGNITEQREKTDANASNSSTDLVTTTEYDGVYDIPVSIKLPNGTIQTTTIDGSGNILTQTASGILSASGASRSATVGYTYDAKWQLTLKTDAEGNMTTYSYGSGQLVSLTIGTGSTASTQTFSYDSHGNLLSQTDAEGKTKTFSYTPFDLAGTGTTAEGIVTSALYDANNNKTSESRSLSGNIASSTIYEYDALDRVVKTTKLATWNLQLETLFAYDGNGNLASEQVGSGAKVQYVYDAMNRVTEKRVKTDPNDSSKDLVTSYVYDRNGNILQTTDPRGNTTTSEYDLFDRITKKIDALGAYVTYAYDLNGNLTEVKSYDSSNTLLQKIASDYDGYWRTIRTTRHDLTASGTNNLVSIVSYDLNGNKTSTIDQKGHTTTYTYDDHGRLTSTTDALGNTTSQVYDKRGLVTSKTITGSGASSLTTIYAYDDDGRLTTETDATSHTKTYEYDANGQITSATDENGHVTARTYDSLGHTLSETRYGSGTSSVISYDYDLTGNRISETDGEWHIISYDYDTLNRLIATIYHDGKSIDYTYDKNGNLTQTTDPNGTVTTSTYDANNRLTHKSIARSTNTKGTTNEHYAYDDLGRLTTATSTGGTDTSLTFSYDVFGRLTSETQTIGSGSGKTVNYEYDANGNRISVASGSGYLASYSYDAIDRLTGVTYNSGSIANYTYTGTLLDIINLGNGTSTSYGYDSLLRLSSLRAERSNPGQIILDRTYSYDFVSNITSDGQRSYVYDFMDRLTSASASSGVTLPNASESFNYDLVGNRTTANGLTYSGNVLNQYLSVSGSTLQSYTYDNNGNLTGNGVFSFVYDYKNRLVEVKKTSDNSIVVQYVYDVLGRRVEKVTPTTKTNYIYAGENAIIEENTNLSTSAVIETSRVYGNGTDDLLAYETDDTTLADGDFAELSFCQSRVLPYESEFAQYSWSGIVSRCEGLNTTYNTTERKMFFVHKDQVGSTLALTDMSGSTVQEYAYDSFGKSYIKSGTWYIAVEDYTGNLHGNNRLFTGREYEKEIGLYYYRARFYDPSTGRFISRDPIGTADQVNLYTYVGNNPLINTDPTGLATCKELIKKSDATRLFLNDLNKWKTNIWSATFPKFYYADETSSQESYFNIKYREDYQKIAIDPDTGKQNCTGVQKPGGCFVYVDSQKVELSQLGNFLVGYNGYWAWFTLNDTTSTFSNIFNDVYKAGYFTENTLNRGNYFNNSAVAKDALNDELRDRPWYDSGYGMAKLQNEWQKTNLRWFIQKAK